MMHQDLHKQCSSLNSSSLVIKEEGGNVLQQKLMFVCIQGQSMTSFSKISQFLEKFGMEFRCPNIIGE